MDVLAARLGLKDGDVLDAFWRRLGGEVLRDALDRNCWLSVEFQVLAVGRAQILLSDAPSAPGLCVVARVLCQFQ